MFGFVKVIVIALGALSVVGASAVPEVADAQFEKRQGMLLQYFNSSRNIITTVFSVGSVINQITSGAASVATHDGTILVFGESITNSLNHDFQCQDSSARRRLSSVMLLLQLRALQVLSPVMLEASLNTRHVSFCKK